MVTHEDRKAAIDYFSSGDVEAFSVDSRWVLDSPGLRLDAEHYNPQLAKALGVLKNSGLELRPLGELVERIFIPPRVKRVYVDADHGLPFLQGSHIVHFTPADIKYVSKQAQKKLDQLIIAENWILITRSGTIGRTVIVPPSWDGWAASEHLLRIVPADNGECPVGYLYAFLGSFCGQAQLTSQIYGAVVDELTEDQTARILIPVPTTDEQREAAEAIANRAMRAVELKEQAVALDHQSLKLAEDFMRKRRERDDEPPDRDKLSMYPLEPEEALGAFMEVDRDAVLEREKKEKDKKS